uniref:UBX domain protein 2A n=1 Tax=Gallus gallus TaxID=9031 RepID=A0A8V0Y390_CHICK
VCFVLLGKQKWMCKSRTGDQILNGTEQNHDYFVDNLFEEAQKIGAICMSPTTVKNQVELVLIINVFCILQQYSNSSSDVFFLRELPFELQKVFEKEEVDVKVEDKKDELYLSSKKPIFHPFSGHGYRLGSATPRIISKAREDHQGAADKRCLPVVPLNDLEPITNIQIWLADGERIIQKFNVSHRISHVRDFITKYQGSEGGVPFMLTTSLPFRELQDETLTLQEAKLQNAVVVQRLRKTTEPFRLLAMKAPDDDCKTAATPNGRLKNEQKNAMKSTSSN